jgi:hypothetical protein
LPDPVDSVYSTFLIHCACVLIDLIDYFILNKSIQVKKHTTPYTALFRSILMCVIKRLTNDPTCTLCTTQFSPLSALSYTNVFIDLTPHTYTTFILICRHVGRLSPVIRSYMKPFIIIKITFSDF